MLVFFLQTMYIVHVNNRSRKNRNMVTIVNSVCQLHAGEVFTPIHYHILFIKHRTHVQYWLDLVFRLVNFSFLYVFSCRSFAAVGVEPGVMGVGPAVAIPAAVKSAGLELKDIDLFEINEVFA